VFGHSEISSSQWVNGLPNLNTQPSVTSHSARAFESPSLSCYSGSQDGGILEDYLLESTRLPAGQQTFTLFLWPGARLQVPALQLGLHLRQR
jgi:hypothetical protein